MTLSVDPNTSPTPSGPRRAGAVDQAPSGSWRVRFRTPDGRRRSKTFPTRADAELFRLGCEQIYSNQPALTLDGLAEDFFDQRSSSGVFRSVDHEQSVWRAHIEGTPMASMLLRSITRREVRTWLSELRKKKASKTIGKGKTVPTSRTLSPDVARKALVLVRLVLQAAMDDELIEANPARDVRIGPVAAPTTEGWTLLTAEEIAAVRSIPGAPVWATVTLTVAIFTGLRQGELWGLHWTDVTLDGPQPKIIVRFSHKGPPKSGRIRHVPLLAPAREALRRWKEVCPKHPDDLVFLTVTGERRTMSDDAGWKDVPIVRRDRSSRTGVTHKLGWKTLAGITRRVRFHDLRHTAASHLVMGTWGRAWRMEEVRDFLGHSSTKTTQKYAHLSPDHLHRAASETALGSCLGLEPEADSLNTLISKPFERAAGVPDTAQQWSC